MKKFLIALGSLAVAAVTWQVVPAFAAEVQAVSYYVDAVSGSDSNDGKSSSTPWKSVAKVNGFNFAAGDTVLFKRGVTWAETLTLSDDSATSSARLTVDAYGTGALPTFAPGPTVTNCVFISEDYWTVKNIRATGCKWAGFEISGDHNELRQVYADHNVVGVSVTDKGAFNTVVSSDLIDNNKMSVNTDGDLIPGWDKTDDDDSGAFGVLLNGDDNTIMYNVIKGGFAFSYDYDWDGAAVEIFNGDRNKILYNVTADNDTFTELGAWNETDTATADDNVFAYNTVTTTKVRGVFLITRGGGTEIGPVNGTVAVNNSVHLPGEGSEGWVCYAGCTTGMLTVHNNIISVPDGKALYTDGKVDEGHNVYQGQIQLDYSGGALGTGSVSANPLFADAALHLAAGSPAINRGIGFGYTDDLDGNPVDSTPDAGAYQYVS